MSPLPDESIEEFRQLFKEKYNKVYTLEEAREAAENFVSFFELLHEIDMREKITDSTKKANPGR